MARIAIEGMLAGKLQIFTHVEELKGVIERYWLIEKIVRPLCKIIRKVSLNYLNKIILKPTSNNEDKKVRREPKLEFIYESIIDLGQTINAGVTPKGQRLIIPIEGGSFEGPKIKGEIMKGGWDWPLIVPGTYFEIKADYMLKTDDGVIIQILNRAKYYETKGEPDAFGFTIPEFEAPFGDYEWLNDGSYIGTQELVMDEEKNMKAVKICVYKAV